MDCEAIIQSEDYIELMLPIGRRLQVPEGCRQELGLYDVLSVPYTRDFFRTTYVFGYYMIPKLFGLLDVQAMEAAGIMQVRRRKNLGLTGTGVLIGFIDTGIDFACSCFRRPDGTTRVAAVWDQTIQGEQARPPEKFLYGREYTQEELNEAVRSDRPYEIVPSRDENGHGTFVASLAAGNETETITGAAPDAAIAMVKLKPAKQNMRDYYLIREEADAYQENDIMAGVRYLEQLSERLRMPLAICLALGTNQGSRNGTLPLCRCLEAAGKVNGTVIVVGTGNETTRAHHYEGTIDRDSMYENVEVRVGAEEQERGFTLELWGREPELFSMAIRSPGGEYIPRMNIRLGKKEDISFFLEGTVIEFNYRVVVQETGEFLIFLRIRNPAQGIWTFQVFNDLKLTGRFHMWLPMQHFISPDTVFLNPTPAVTLTSPSDADSVIAVGAYQERDDSIYLYSGRGYRPDGAVRPDLAAPGVDVAAYVPGAFGDVRTVQRSGSSAASAIMAGAAALLLELSFVRKFREVMTSDDARAFFIRGAKRNTSMLYPNREWGYGILDMYGVFEQIRSQER